MKRVRFGRSLSLSAVLVFFAVAEVAVVSAAERSQAVVGRQRGGYTIDAWSVYYAGRKVEGLSSSGFVDLGGGYGKDAWTVVYRGRKIEGAAAQSFEYVGRGRAKDAWRSYFRGRPESDRCGAVCDPGCPLGDGYAAECGEIYFRGRKVEGLRRSRSRCWAAATARMRGRSITAAGRSKGLRRSRSRCWAAATARMRGRSITAAGRSKGLRRSRSWYWAEAMRRTRGGSISKVRRSPVPRPLRSRCPAGIEPATGPCSEVAEGGWAAHDDRCRRLCRRERSEPRCRGDKTFLSHGGCSVRERARGRMFLGGSWGPS